MEHKLTVVYRTLATPTPVVSIRIDVNKSSGSFLVNGESNGLVVLYGGDANTYELKVNTGDEPFWIKYENCANRFQE